MADGTIAIACRWCGESPCVCTETAYRRMVRLEASAQRALNFLTDFHCDNQRDVIEDLRNAIKYG
jgi:hypothetical protein